MKKSNMSDDVNQTNRSFGQVDENLTGMAQDVDAFESIPTVVPGKPGFDLASPKIAGVYVRTKRVYSDKFTAPKLDADGAYRDLHVLKDGKGVLFGIWSVGTLGAILPKLAVGDYIEITYKGLADKALKPGQNPPHVFTFKGRGVNGGALQIDWDANAEGDTLARPSTAPQSAMSARQ